MDKKFKTFAKEHKYLIIEDDILSKNIKGKRWTLKSRQILDIKNFCSK